jgi:3-hydroxyacyl-[acyl-carrier-protein] dehydratase
MPIMPGVFLVQSMAQAAVILALAGTGPDDTRRIRLAGVKKARFRKMVEPGTELRIEVELSELSASRWQFGARTFADGTPVADVTGLLAADD